MTMHCTMDAHGEARLQPKVILAVDDDTAVRRLVSRALSRKYLVLSAPDGKEAARLMVNRKIDLVLTDIRMPEMGGLELARLLHDRYPSVPVAFVSAWMDDLPAAQASELGPWTLTKPFAITDLMTVVERVLASAPTSSPPPEEEPVEPALPPAPENPTATAEHRLPPVPEKPTATAEHKLPPVPEKPTATAEPEPARQFAPATMVGRSTRQQIQQHVGQASLVRECRAKMAGGRPLVLPGEGTPFQSLLGPEDTVEVSEVPPQRLRKGDFVCYGENERLALLRVAQSVLLPDGSTSLLLELPQGGTLRPTEPCIVGRVTAVVRKGVRIPMGALAFCMKVAGWLRTGAYPSP